jgi:hypothetical protein
VVYDYAAAMIAVLLLQAWAPSRATPWIGAAILVSFGAGAIQVSGFSLHRHFNQNDLYHLVQMAAMISFYRGGRRLQDRT